MIQTRKMNLSLMNSRQERISYHIRQNGRNFLTQKTAWAKDSFSGGIVMIGTEFSLSGCGLCALTNRRGALLSLGRDAADRFLPYHRLSRATAARVERTVGCTRDRAPRSSADIGCNRQPGTARAPRLSLAAGLDAELRDSLRGLRVTCNELRPSCARAQRSSNCVKRSRHRLPRMCRRHASRVLPCGSAWLSYA